MLSFILIRRKYFGHEEQGEFPPLILCKQIWSLSFFFEVQVYENSHNQIHQNSITVYWRLDITNLDISYQINILCVVRQTRCFDTLYHIP